MQQIFHRMRTNALVRSAYYGLLETVSLGRGMRRRVNGHALRLTPQWWRGFPQDYEWQAFACLKQLLRPGDVALDIGAHVGLYTLAMAELVGRTGVVVAFEPDPTARQFLQRHVRLNGYAPQVRVEPLAVGAEAAEARLYLQPGLANPGSSLYPQEALKDSVAATIISIDQYAQRLSHSPRLIKIDVEGCERLVIQGARETLTRSPVEVLCEVHADNMGFVGDTPEGLLKTICSFGYEAFSLDGKRLGTLNAGGQVLFRPAGS